ncbi:MAG: succinate dehydrogenase assembly factor 2 [Pseudomonadota bacterium]
MKEEAPDVRLKRLRLRSWRRGIREMDLLLGAFADAELPGMSVSELDAYEAFMAEDDQSLFAWISGRERGPDIHAAMLSRIQAFHAR